MKKPWLVFVVAAAGISLSALGVAAQGPQGVGAGEAARSAAPHSYNPLHWMKKKQPTATETLDSNSALSAKLTAKLQEQDVLPASGDLKDSCSTFPDLGTCLAALHAAHNVGLDFNCLKAMLTGVQTSVYMSSCANPTNGQPMNMAKAIRTLKPNANFKSAAKRAKEQSRDDLREAGA